MGPYDVRDLWCERDRTNHGSRSGAERREDGGSHRRVSLVAGMEPVGPAEIAGAAILAVECVDRVEPIQADERPAVAQAHLLDDRVNARGWQPAADAEHARV